MEAGRCEQDDEMRNPEDDSDDEFGDGINWGDEPKIEATASCNLENPEECEACQ